MKTFTLTLLLLCTFALTSTAQQSKSLIDISKQQTLTGQTESASALNYRITGIRSFDMNGGIWEGGDSTALEYSGTRGSDIMNSILDPDVLTNYDWDGFVYTPDNRTIRNYNGNDQVIEDIYQTFNGATWDDNWRTLTTYNSNDQMASETRQNYNAGAWEDAYRYVYVYDNGNVVGRTNEDWNGSSWEKDWRYVYTYDGSGNQTTRVYQNWNGSSWEDQYRNVYSHDGSGNQLQDLRQDWNGSNWEDDFRYNSQYDNENWLTTSTRQSWNGSDWENDWRDIYTHNSGDYYYSEVVNQDYIAGDWENDYKYEYTFTSFNKIDEAISYNWDGSLWEGSLRQIVYYEQYDDGSTGIQTTADLGVQIFPNPAADYVMFRNDGSEETMYIEVYNMEGRLVTKLSGTNQAKWYTRNNVASGMYNYVVTIGGEKQSGQVVIH